MYIPQSHTPHRESRNEYVVVLFKNEGTEALQRWKCEGQHTTPPPHHHHHHVNTTDTPPTS